MWLSKQKVVSGCKSGIYGNNWTFSKMLFNMVRSNNIMNGNNFEPQIVAFCCHYCAYGAADLAGAMRLNYPPNIRIIRLPCTGKVDILYVLKAFENGADGVYVAGCLEGNCHFVDGNIKAKRRVVKAKKILDEIGIGGERLEMYNMSASMGPKFVEVAHEMTDRIKQLGPSPLRRNK
jgi:coenzyme F420-reducing hydrogenase delta subunit